MVSANPNPWPQEEKTGGGAEICGGRRTEQAQGRAARSSAAAGTARRDTQQGRCRSQREILTDGSGSRKPLPLGCCEGNVSRGLKSPGTNSEQKAPSRELLCTEGAKCGSRRTQKIPLDSTAPAGETPLAAPRVIVLSKSTPTYGKIIPAYTCANIVSHS